MRKTERVYVCESETVEAMLLTTELSQAEEFMRLPCLKEPTQRVFTEEDPWTPARIPPDSGRKVLAVYARRATMLPTLIVARFGSEGKWVAEDHDMRVTYLDQGTVIGWQEMPVFPEVV